MPIDARSLLRASTAKQGGGIADRFASYHPKTGALRCSACDLLTLKHESLWASHAASKSHRANVQRIEANEAAAAKEVDNAKRKPSAEEDVVEQPKRTKTDNVDEDDEWARFQAEVLNAAPVKAAVAGAPTSSTYVDATIEVAPVLKGNAGDAAGGGGEDADLVLDPTAVDETPEEKRRRLERESREEILARLDEEQRVQEEADDRVRALKDRLNKMRQARAARKAGSGS